MIMLKYLIYYGLPLFLIVFVWGIIQSKGAHQYKYLFRKSIFSKSGNYELGSVLYGRIYKAQYLFLPQINQYLVYSNVEMPFVLEDTSLVRSKFYTREYVLLDSNGKEIRRTDTHIRLSNRSGLFCGPTHYSTWLIDGDTTLKKYDLILNEDFKMSQNEFNETYKAYYKKASYVEWVYLRADADDRYESAVLFKSGDKVSILLSGLASSRMYCHLEEDDKTNLFEHQCSLTMGDASAYPQSSPLLEVVRMETELEYPYKVSRGYFNKELSITSYKNASGRTWYGVMEWGGIPLYIPGEKTGEAWVDLTIEGEEFELKIPEVEKYLVYYNLGLRTFQLPKSYRSTNALVFVESSQNSGNNRIGGGVYVFKKVDQYSIKNDLPNGVTEERYNRLPIELQEALMFPNQTLQLNLPDQLTCWLPEIELLANLKSLQFSTTLDTIPAELYTLIQLESLSIRNSSIKHVSDSLARLKNLKSLDLFGNHLTTFPESICQLTQLESLDLSANESLSVLPSSIIQLTHLTRLDIGMTNINTLPEEMANMKQLYIWDTSNLEDRLPEKFHHLFDVYKTVPKY